MMLVEIATAERTLCYASGPAYLAGWTLELQGLGPDIDGRYAVTESHTERDAEGIPTSARVVVRRIGEETSCT